jgi:recombination protein RecT
MSIATTPVGRLDSAMNGQKRPAPDHPTIARIQAKAIEFGKAMPKVMTVDRFMRVAIGAIRRNPKLLECDPLSLMGSLLVAAQLGLEVNTPLGHYYLIPRYNGKTGKNEADGQIGYKGWIELLNRTGAVRDLAAHVVYERDEFTYSLGDDEKIVHVPALGDRGEAIAFYVIVKLTNGGVRRRVLSRHDVDQYRKRSKSPNNGPWVSDYNAMALKTTFLREVPWLPMSLELREAVSYENAVDAQAKIVYKDGSNQIDYEVPEPVQQIESQYQQPDYEPEYEPEPEPVPVEKPRQTRRAPSRLPAPATVIEEGVPEVVAPSVPVAPKHLSESNPDHVRAFESWISAKETEVRAAGLDHLCLPGALARAIYANLVERGIAQQCADTYGQKRLNIAKLRRDWDETLNLLNISFGLLLKKSEPEKNVSGEAPWQDGNDGYQGDY